MPKIAWREKFRAVLLHFLVTLAMAVAAAALIFLVWYPDPFQTMLGGAAFFLLITVCDLVLGPLTSLIIYNSKKSRRELIFDYSIVGIVQLAAFVYGVMSISNARPVYIAFVVDRFEVIIAQDLLDTELQAAKDPYRTRPKWGPKLIGAQMPTDREERNDLVLAVMDGKDLRNYPRYFVPYENVIAEVKRVAKPMDELYKRFPQAKQLIAEERVTQPDGEMRWLPIQGTKAIWTVLLDANTGALLGYIPIDPF